VGGAAVAIPFVSTFQPSERAKAAGAPVEVDISTLNPGELKRVEWRGKPVWVVRRTKDQLDALTKVESQLADPKSDRKDYPTPKYAKNGHRSIKPEFLVVVGICSHLGCSPSEKFQPGAQPSRRMTGQAAFCAPAMGQLLTWQGGFIRTSQRLII
jgi:ubiquinol-cytochrome c reductase iron-sulfur subunit